MAHMAAASAADLVVLLRLLRVHPLFAVADLQIWTWRMATCSTCNVNPIAYLLAWISFLSACEFVLDLSATSSRRHSMSKLL